MDLFEMLGDFPQREQERKQSGSATWKNNIYIGIVSDVSIDFIR